MPAPKPRFRPWPKRFDGLRQVTDKDKLREQFLSSAHYAWEDFCKQFNYDPSARKRQEFPSRAWQQEWLQQQTQATEDGLMGEAVNLKRQIAKARLAFPGEWQKTAGAMKSLADFILQREVQAAHHDQENAEAIAKGKVQPLCKVTPMFLTQLALAQIRVQELQRMSLLMPAADAYKAVIPIRDTDPVEVEAESEEERLRSLEVQLVGGGSLSEQKMMQIHSKWIDQQAAHGDPDEETPKPEDDRSPESDLLPITEVDA